MNALSDKELAEGTNLFAECIGIRGGLCGGQTTLPITNSARSTLGRQAVRRQFELDRQNPHGMLAHAQGRPRPEQLKDVVRKSLCDKEDDEIFCEAVANLALVAGGRVFP